jgi:anthranilate synthase component 1
MQAEPLVDASNLAALRRRLGPELAPALLLSAAAGPQGRFDLLPLVNTPPLVVPYPGHPEHAERLAEFESQLRAIKVGAGAASGPLFAGGWLLYLAYEFGAVFEPSVPLQAPELAEPLALLWRVPAALVRDRHTQLCELVGADREVWAARLAAAGFIADATGKSSGASSALQQRSSGASSALQLSEDDPQRFLDGVARIHDYLIAGDVFQVNLSRAWRAVADAPMDLDVLFARLSVANPAPFAAVLSHGDWGLASSSPERLVSVHGKRVDTRPIAGTRRRDADPAVDAQLLAELQRDPKERAEHMVSNVSGRLRDDVSAWSLLRALFPGGTITGCPKVRCMQIIAELEQVGRGAYTGALGYIGDNGALDLNILIRTISVARERLLLRAGAGIVADSIASRELMETRAKALGMLRALDAAT